MLDEDLQLSEERLKMVLEGSQQGFWEWNIETGEVQRNERWAEMLGYTLKDFENTTDTWTNLIHPEDRDAAWASIIDHLEGRKNRHAMEYRMLAKDGSYRWILDHAKIVRRAADGRPLRMSGTHMDVTDRKQFETERDDLIRSLKGIIQICSYCHSVRDDKGTWETLFTYLAKHSEAGVSHGICPDCLPGILDTIQQKDGFAGE